MIEIHIAHDFSKTPGGRNIDHGSYSGEEFRKNFLEEHFESNENYLIKIILDETYGYATSFLEEAFGGLSRKYGKDRVKKRLLFVSKEEPLLIDEISSYIDQ